jgi:hypothetical protein
MILIVTFATIDSCPEYVTPVHHLMVMVSSAAFDSVVTTTSDEYALARVSDRSGS